MSYQHAEHVVTTEPDAVRRVLLDPLALPEWNPAFHRVDGPAQVTAGAEYHIRVRPGLAGTLTYTRIDANRIDMTWQVPGFRETGRWTLQSHATGTSVRHEFEHEGALATVLQHAYRGVAELRLQRLDERLRHIKEHTHIHPHPTIGDST
jgi:hypothetical protein